MRGPVGYRARKVDQGAGRASSTRHRKGRIGLPHAEKSDGLRLLRCLNDTQACGREEAKVDPPSAAQEIGLEVGSERYHDALVYLAEEGALVGDEHTAMHTEEVEGLQPYAYAVYVFTRRALILLEEAEGTRSTTLDS